MRLGRHDLFISPVVDELAAVAECYHALGMGVLSTTPPRVQRFWAAGRRAGLPVIERKTHVRGKASNTCLTCQQVLGEFSFELLSMNIRQREPANQLLRVNSNWCLGIVDQVSEEAPGKLWQMLDKVALALEYLHERGVVHAQVKPDNTRVGNDEIAKLTGFECSMTTKELASVDSIPHELFYDERERRESTKHMLRFMGKRLGAEVILAHVRGNGDGTNVDIDRIAETCLSLKHYHLQQLNGVAHVGHRKLSSCCEPSCAVWNEVMTTPDDIAAQIRGHPDRRAKLCAVMFNKIVDVGKEYTGLVIDSFQDVDADTLSHIPSGDLEKALAAYLPSSVIVDESSITMFALVPDVPMQWQIKQADLR
ncbi:hypothetical protein ON010_g7518 [Phytophthora cinnamomi]|nr:hypothetical protein ON010_g7518 [Phytophthora cinnamomi]